MGRVEWVRWRCCQTREWWRTEEDEKAASVAMAAETNVCASIPHKDERAAVGVDGVEEGRVEHAGNDAGKDEEEEREGQRYDEEVEADARLHRPESEAAEDEAGEEERL